MDLIYQAQDTFSGALLLKPCGTGKVLFVDSNATNASTTSGGLTPETAFSTVDSAVAYCTANKGDTIVVLPGHAESFTAANGFNADVEGIKIIGIGTGTERPTFTFADTDATVAVGAKSVWLENLVFKGGISAVVDGVIVNAFTDVTIKNCEWQYGSTTGYDFVDMISVPTTGAHRLTIDGCRFLAEEATGTAAGIHIADRCDNVHITNCVFMGDYSTTCILIDAAQEHTIVVNNRCYNQNAAETFLEAATGTTAIIAFNHGYAPTSTGAGAITNTIVCDGAARIENYIARAQNVQALTNGAAGLADDAD